jgi:hypothetical protein
LKLYIGTSGQEVKFVLDTGSSAIVIESIDCSTCQGTRYDASTSSNFLRFTHGSQEQILYGSVKIRGDRIWDDVYFDRERSMGLSQFTLFLINEQYGLDDVEVDGILGLSRETSR